MKTASIIIFIVLLFLMIAPIAFSQDLTPSDTVTLHGKKEFCYTKEKMNLLEDILIDGQNCQVKVLNRDSLSQENEKENARLKIIVAQKKQVIVDINQVVEDQKKRAIDQDKILADKDKENVILKGELKKSKIGNIVTKIVAVGAVILTILILK